MSVQKFSLEPDWWSNENPKVKAVTARRWLGAACRFLRRSGHAVIDQGRKRNEKDPSRTPRFPDLEVGTASLDSR
jgi:hypothetical protein